VAKSKQEPSTLEQWLIAHPIPCRVLGLGLVLLAVVLGFLNAFEVITGALKYLYYVLLGVGMALLMAPGQLRKRWIDD